MKVIIRQSLIKRKTMDKWVKLKLQIFLRDNYACNHCNKRYQWSGLIGDHIIPIVVGGEEFNKNNIQTLCIKCSKIKTVEDNKKYFILVKHGLIEKMGRCLWYVYTPMEALPTRHSKLEVINTFNKLLDYDKIISNGSY